MENGRIKNVRIDLVDALRGFALMGIILVHNVEHFDIANTVISSSPVLQAMDAFLYDAMFFLFGGKAYAMFALLFGFSFYIQFENQKKKGNAFAGRFAWRMAILFCFGVFHVLFLFRRDSILLCYCRFIADSFPECIESWFVGNSSNLHA
ncbi:MAG: heparan-alpha-glucosaminide N-acetyltransferase domain-containing protein [Tannerellaceae bacterium]|nr:heparan-alpha-glucosaminide N-acetyltransferase domain-containing protein [Tannerellaceae bacterium]